MKIHISINSYNRPELLQDLVNNLSAQASQNYQVNINIYDDGSEKQDDIRNMFLKMPHVNFIAMRHHGKTQYWQIWNRIIRKLPVADLYIFLPDDVKPVDNFFEKIVSYYKKLPKNAGSLNILNEKYRSLVPSWGSHSPFIEYIAGQRFINSGWFDLCGIITDNGIKQIRKRLIRIDAGRWMRDPNKSSGVGEYISHNIRKKYQLFATPETLVEHVSKSSEMNTIEREKNKLKAWDLPYIIAGMATIPGRESYLKKAVDSVINSVDKLYIAFNNMQVPNWAMNNPKIIGIITDNSIGDGFKFKALDFLKDPVTFGFDDFYFFSLDDDLIYPQNYFTRYILEIENKKRKAIICTHGKVMPKRVKKFYGSHVVMFHTSTRLDQTSPVNLPGTGTVGFHSSTIKFNTDDIKLPNMADIWLGIAAQNQNVPIYAISRPANWLRILPVPETIYDQHRDADMPQTKAFNSISWKLNEL